MQHPLGKKVPGCGKLVVDSLSFIDLRACPGNTGNVFSVRPKNTLYTAFHSFALWDPASKKDFSTTRHAGGKCLPRKVYNSRKEKLSTAFHASYATRGSSQSVAPTDDVKLLLSRCSFSCRSSRGSLCILPSLAQVEHRASGEAGGFANHQVGVDFVAALRFSTLFHVRAQRRHRRSRQIEAGHLDRRER